MLWFMSLVLMRIGYGVLCAAAFVVSEVLVNTAHAAGANSELRASQSPGLRVERIFGPEIKTGPYKHPACFDQLRNGDLYLVYYGGEGEYATQTSVFGARLRRGSRTWSKPTPIASNPLHSVGNGVVWQAPDGAVWLFYVTRQGETWSTSRIMGKISRDGARSWSDAFPITHDEGTMVRGRPMVLHNGEFLLPIYRETGHDTEFTGPDTTSLVLRYDVKTKLWVASQPIRSIKGNEQPSVVELEPNHLLAFCRRSGSYEPTTEGYIIRAESRDGGRTWSEGVNSTFPNPNAAIDFLKLRDGSLMLVYNDSMNDRTPLTVALSTDQGKTFPHRRNLMEGSGDFAYPTAIEAQDGTLQVMFTSDERTVIRRAIFTRSWVEAGGRLR